MITPTVTPHDLPALRLRLPPEGRTQLTERLRVGQACKTPLSRWFVRHGVANPAMRLFCISYAGGGASVFRSWSDRLPDCVEVCAVQLAGRESRAGKLDPLS
jgi:medium-chain acyl-[acyl-carrier-protein] hydrolase